MVFVAGDEEVVVEKEENVFPMIPTGAAVSDMVLEHKK